MVIKHLDFRQRTQPSIVEVIMGQKKGRLRQEQMGIKMKIIPATPELRDLRNSVETI